MNKKHIFRKKTPEMFAGSKKSRTFAPVKRKGHGSVAQLNRASDYGSEGYRFESCRSHEKEYISDDGLFFRIYTPSHASPLSYLEINAYL